MKRADKMFEKLGFTKLEENDYVIEYERDIVEFNNVKQKIEIVHKAKEVDGGNCIIFSIDPDMFDQNEIGNVNIGMSTALMKACLRKVKEKKNFH